MRFRVSGPQAVLELRKQGPGAGRYANPGAKWALPLSASVDRKLSDALGFAN